MNSKRLMAHWSASCAFGGIGVPEPQEESRPKVSSLQQSQTTRVVLCPECLKHCPKCGHATQPPYVDWDGAELVKVCDECQIHWSLWLDWDGSTHWWDRVREARIIPISDHERFQTWCLDRVRRLPNVVVYGKENDWAVAIFCADQREAEQLRCDVPKLVKRDRPPYAWCWVGIRGFGGGLRVSFEFSATTTRPIEFLKSTLEWGPMRLAV